MKDLNTISQETSEERANDLDSAHEENKQVVENETTTQPENQVKEPIEHEVIEENESQDSPVSASVENAESITNQSEENPAGQLDETELQTPVESSTEQVVDEVEPQDTSVAESKEETDIESTIDSTKVEKIENEPAETISEMVSNVVMKESATQQPEESVDQETDSRTVSEIELKDDVVEEKEEKPASIELESKTESEEDSGQTVIPKETEPATVDNQVELSEEQADKPVEAISSDVTETPVDAADTVKVESDEEDIDENSIENFLEDDEQIHEEVEERKDYSTFSKEELINILADKLENAPIQDIKYDVDSVKSNFYKKHKAEADIAKKKFMGEGGDPTDFVFDADPFEEKLKELLNQYKRLKTEYNKNLELEKESNLKKKYAIIEDIKDLINGQESINKTFNDFRELQKRWHETGLVPQAEVRNLWENYHHNVEKFYDFVKINRELRDLDLKRNLESKVKLCEDAEELMMEPSVVKAFRQLQKLHEQWREIGPVPNENREDIWERFKSATTAINKAHQEYFENLKQEQTNNLNAKIALCEKAEELANLTLDKHKDWEQKSDELIEVQKLWKTIGFATKKENNKVFERFRNACDIFFNRKRDFYLEHKEIQNNNLQLKTELCIQAEALKDSTDWKKTSNELIKLQKDWKEIGPVPRKHSDAIWKRFRAACNEFFERKESYFANIDKEYSDNLQAKQDLIDIVRNFAQLENIEENINQLKNFQKEWTEIGHVPFKLKDKIQKEFRDAVNEQFDKLKIDSDKRSVLVYKQRLENISQGTKANRQYRVEKDRILDHIRQLESDIVLLENNIGFFAKTKNAESLIKDVNLKIEKAKRKIKTEKQKLDLINKFE